MPLFRNIVAQFESADGEPLAGVRIVEPPVGSRQAIRGNLYAVVDLLGDHPERVRFVEGLLSTIQRAYYNEKGSQSHVLAESVRAARRKIDDWNHNYPDRPLRAGIICAGFVNGRLMAIHNGPAMALVTTGNRVERYPSVALGAVAESLPDRPSNWEIYRQEVEQSVGLFMGTTRWVDVVPIRTIAGTVAHLGTDNCRAAAIGLSIEAGGRELPGLLFFAERTPVVQGGAPRSTPLTGTRRPRHADAMGLPTALGARPPVHGIPPAGDAVPAPPPDTTVTPSSPAVTSAPLSVPASSTSASGRGESTVVPEPEPMRDEPWPAAGEIEAQLPAADAHAHRNEPMASAAGELAHAGGIPSFNTLAATVTASTAGVYARAKEVMAGMLPDKNPAPAQNPYAYREPPVQAEADAFHGAPQRTFWSDVNARVQEAVSDVEPYVPPQPARGSRARMFVLLAVLLFLLAPVLAYVYWGGAAESSDVEVENLLIMAETRYNNGQLALNGGDEDTARAMCLDADGLLQQAVAIGGRSESALNLSDQIERCINATMRTRYLYELTEPLIRFPGDAEPHRVLVVDENIFVLDRGRQLVELYRLDGTRSFVPDQTPEVVLREGQAVGGATVGRLVDVAWQPVIAGYQEKASLLTLDRNNQIFLYDPRVEGASFAPQGAQTPLRVPNQVEIYLGRTYISDEGVNQIFRYDAGRLADEPQPWFAEQAKANLSGVIRMVIDGDIWLLYNRGSLIRYSGGAQIPFSLDSGAITPDQPVDMMIGDEVAPYIYIADATRESILVFDKEGAYQFQLLAPEENPLRDLRGIFIEPVAGNLYILTKEALYQHPIPN